MLAIATIGFGVHLVSIIFSGSLVCLVTDIETNRDNQAIVRSTIKMAHELGMKVVAEGIETEQDEIYLKSLGCDVGQGYYYARPLSVADLEQWHHSYRKKLLYTSACVTEST